MIKDDFYYIVRHQYKGSNIHLDSTRIKEYETACEHAKVLRRDSRIDNANVLEITVTVKNVIES
jgi:hypothetical protein